MTRAMADTFLSLLNSFFGLGELDGELTNHFEEFFVLFLEAGEFTPRGSACCASTQPSIHGGFVDARIFRSLSHRYPSFFYFVNDLRFYFFRYSISFFVSHDTMVICFDLCV
jgi:hypothetical protein